MKALGRIVAAGIVATALYLAWELVNALERITTAGGVP